MRHVLLASLPPLAVATAQAQPALVFAKGGAIGLAPPAGMREAQGFAGFEHAAGASILLTEMPPQAFAQAATGFETGPLPAGLTLGGKPEAFTLPDGTPARLWRGTQATAAGPFAKWLLLANGRAVTALVTAQVPAEQAARLGPALEAALRSVTLRAPAAAEAGLAALPFTVDQREGFRLVRTLAGAGALFTDGPKDEDPESDQPLIIVASSLGGVAATDRAALARRAFAGLSDNARATIESEAASPDGYRIIGGFARDGRPFTVVQHMRFGAGGGYVRTVCIAPAASGIAGPCDRFAAGVRLK